ncbi:MAG: hypothetical protein M1836_000019 [Candelina mexicana]|nr:MAG: hypothetical protein M1836_000019 [Candelina mexicana]
MAKEISPPWGTGRKNTWFCGVDYQRTEYKLEWSGSMNVPNLSGFPNIEGLKVEKVNQSAEVRHCWQVSTLLDYGSYAQIRILDSSAEFPVMKLAHHLDVRRQYIENESNILKSLRSLPVVQVHSDPLEDENGIFGLRMQLLQRIEIDTLVERLDEVKEAVDKVHEAGVIINDISPSNVMLDQDDNITLIDFGFAGRNGASVPDYFPRWKAERPVFSLETDVEDLKKMSQLVVEQRGQKNRLSSGTVSGTSTVNTPAPSFNRPSGSPPHTSSLNPTEPVLAVGGQ